MNNQFKEILGKVAAETLQSLAFMFAFPEDERDYIDIDSTVAASISFTGPFTGTLALAVSDQVLPKLADNMLGTEGEIPLSQEQDAFKELLNVICGNVLPAIAGKQVIFKIDVPKILAIEEYAELIDGCKTASMAKMDLDEGQIDLYLVIDS